MLLDVWVQVKELLFETKMPKWIEVTISRAMIIYEMRSPKLCKSTLRTAGRRLGEDCYGSLEALSWEIDYLKVHNGRISCF